MTIRILLVDDQALVRAGFASLLQHTDDFEVIGEAGDGIEAVESARRLRPDVVLMDIRMPRADGIEATREIRADPALAATRVIVLTTFELDEYVFAALRAGASGFLLKDVEPDDLRRAVRLVAAGEALLAPSVTRRLIAEYASTPARSPDQVAAVERLTDREREVVTLVAAGLTNTEIGTRLLMSPATARTHVSRALSKLGVRDRAQLVVFAYETGMVLPPLR
jgi:DNA-binding NarL/FixJ family response regulator